MSIGFVFSDGWIREVYRPLAPVISGGNEEELADT
jgi:hypothetical protein